MKKFIGVFLSIVFITSTFQNVNAQVGPNPIDISPFCSRVSALPTLQYGSTGQSVKDLQDFLVSQGFISRTNVDRNGGYGIYGIQTQGAISNFHTKYGMFTGSGPIDAETRGRVSAVTLTKMKEIACIYASTPASTSAISANNNQTNNQNTSDKFKVGDYVQVNSNVTVRSGPTLGVFNQFGGRFPNQLGIQRGGAQGSVVGGPNRADGYVWWNINYDTGVDGWSVENYLTKAVGNPINPVSNTQGSVDIKVNGADNIASLESNAPLTISWTSSPEITHCRINATSVGSGGQNTMSSGVTTQYNNNLVSYTGGMWHPIIGSTATYTISCDRYDARGFIIQGATIQDTARVAINSTDSITPTACVINSLLVTPSVVTSGNRSMLSYGTTGCSSVTLDGGDFSKREMAVSSGSIDIYPTQTTTYTLVAKDSNGVISDRGGNTATVTVGSSIPSTPTASISTSPSTITSGQSSTLSWSSANATSCRLNLSTGYSYNVALSGSDRIAPNQNVTYTLTCMNTNGVTATANATVTVGTTATTPTPTTPATPITPITPTPTTTPVPTTTPTPTATISVSPSTITSGQSSTLSWSSTNATSCRMNLSTGWNYSVALSGSDRIAPTQNVGYVLTCTNTSGASATANATINVNSASTPPTSTPNQPSGEDESDMNQFLQSANVYKSLEAILQQLSKILGN